MRAMVLERAHEALRADELEPPVPGPGEIRVRIQACGVCRTDLHIVDGELPPHLLPIVPGHEIVGVVDAAGPSAERFSNGSRVGVPWLAWTCGECRYCRSGRENLCDRGRFTGYDRNGGYAEVTVADERFALPLPASGDAASLAPLLCAGLIGYRALRLAGPAERVGLYGFGASAHLVAQAATFQGQQVYAFTRPGDERGQKFARDLGAVWAGGSDEAPPEPLDAAVIFAPSGPLVPAALRAVAKGGAVVCAGIHMSDIPAFPYEILWGERQIRSVANLTRQDGVEFLALAEKAGLRTVTTTFALDRANDALDAVRHGRLEGAAVLLP